MGTGLLNRMGRRSATEKVRFEQGLEASHASIWGGVGGGGGSVQTEGQTCKGPEVGECLVCLGSSKEASWLGVNGHGDGSGR